MNKSLIAALLLVCGGALYAKEPSKKVKAGAPALQTAAVAAVKADAAQSRKETKDAAVKTAAARQEQEAEESVVMIDSKGEVESPSAYGAGQEERAVPGGLPSSYGQCKGVIVDAGRNLLIFESPDDGSVSFVQVTVGKANVSWKLVGRIPRSGD